MSATRRLGLVAAVLAVFPLVAIVAASAYWSGSGSGSGSGAAGTTHAVTLSPATPATQLYPGAQAAVALTLTNPNPGSVHIDSLALDTTQGTLGYAVDGAHSGCVLTSLSFTTHTNGGSGWTISGGGALPVTLPNALSMSTGAANACQGASFTIYLKVGP